MSEDQYNSEVKRLEFLLSIGEIDEAKFLHKLNCLDIIYNDDDCEPDTNEYYDAGTENSIEW